MLLINATCDGWEECSRSGVWSSSVESPLTCCLVLVFRMPNRFIPAETLRSLQAQLSDIPDLPLHIDASARARYQSLVEQLQRLTTEEARSISEARGNYEPRSRADCVFRHVPPSFSSGVSDHTHSVSQPTGTSSANLAVYLHRVPALSQPDQGILLCSSTINQWLYRYLRESIPEDPTLGSSDTDAAFLLFLRKWMSILDGMEEVIEDAELHYEAEQMGAARVSMAELANIFNNDADNWRAPAASETCAQWTIARLERKKAITDWVCNARGLILAVFECKRRRVLPSDHIRDAMNRITNVAEDIRLYLTQVTGPRGGTTWSVACTDVVLNEGRFANFRLSMLQVCAVLRVVCAC